MGHHQHRAATLASRKRQLLTVAGDRGLVRTKELLESGIHAQTLQEMKQAGQLVQLSRGLYAVAGADPGHYPELTQLALKVPLGIVCLLTALDFHRLTTQIPRVIELAIPRGASAPRMVWPPVRVHWFGAADFELGLEKHKLDGVEVRIYSRERTLTDCFVFRSKLGIDICIEALGMYKESGSADPGELASIAQKRRMWTVMRPYIEMLWGVGG